MVERTASKRGKRIMRAFKINEISGVDVPAQEHARTTLMKRAVPRTLTKAAALAKEVQAVDFDTVLAERQALEVTSEVGEELRGKWYALQQSFETIACDENVSATDKITAMQQSLQQYVDSLSAQSAEIAEEMTKALTAAPALAELLKNGTNEGDEPMTDAEKRQLDELQKQVAGLTKQLEAATAKDVAKNAAQLQKELDETKAKLDEATKKAETEAAAKAEATAKADMDDAQKAHLAKLDEAGQKAFIAMKADDRKKAVADAVAKAADADPVVYKAADGTEFRKSVGEAVIALAKRADESDKIAKAEREKRENAELAKRADDELKLFSEDIAKRDDKIAILRAIEKMEDGPKTALLKMLEVGGKAIKAAFSTIGHQNEAVAKAAGDFEKRVSEVMARDKISKADAMSKARVEYPEEFKAFQASGN